MCPVRRSACSLRPKQSMPADSSRERASRNSASLWKRAIVTRRSSSGWLILNKVAGCQLLVVSYRALPLATDNRQLITDEPLCLAHHVPHIRQKPFFQRWRERDRRVARGDADDRRVE